ncbi:hypothetical protein BH23PAT2_BH23PAT2_04730 [soil metagenome]
MFKIIIGKFLRHRHFWRHATFDELSEIYISGFFRTLAISLTGVFIPIFLYDIGYSFAAIFGFYIAYFTARTFLHIPVAYIVARIGPKHTILWSFVFQIVSSLSLLTLPEAQWPLWLVATLWAAANNLFFTAYHVDFSKIKHSDHGGKEMSVANIVQHIGGAIGPIVGGIIATIFGPQYIFLVMIFMLVIGLVPLFTSAEPIKIKQKLDFRALPLKRITRDLISYSGLTITHQISVTLWPLYLGLFVLGTNVYLKLGALSSVGFLVSIFSAYAIGRIVDEKKGRALLRASAITDIFIQFAKPFVASLPFALAVNTAGETTATAMRISYQKGLYDAADDLPGSRIVYISAMEASGSFIKALSWVVLLTLGYLVSFEFAMVMGFVLAGLANLLTITERFRGL